MATFRNFNRGSFATASLSQAALTHLSAAGTSPSFARPATVFDPRAPIEAFRPPFGVELPGIRFPPIAFPPVNPTPQPTAPTPPSPTASATDLQILMSQIPAAEDGDVIRSEHFNLMRTALFELAGRLGVGPVQGDLAVSVVPALHAQSGATAWTQDAGLVTATGPAAGAATEFKGWMEVDLPDGARLQEMKVFAKRAGAGTGAFRVILRRVKITDPTSVDDLIVVSITSSADPKAGVSATVKGTVSDPSELEELRTVDNRQFNYLIVAEASLSATAGAAADTAQLNAVQIVCRNTFL